MYCTHVHACDTQSVELSMFSIEEGEEKEGEESSGTGVTSVPLPTEEDVIEIKMETECTECGGDYCPDELLSCTGCGLCYHAFCLLPPLTTLPTSQWFCPQCVAKVKQYATNSLYMYVLWKHNSLRKLTIPYKIFYMYMYGVLIYINFKLFHFFDSFIFAFFFFVRNHFSYTTCTVYIQYMYKYCVYYSLIYFF